MADGTKIEWTDATWTPVKGCTRKSPGCVHCYAEIMAARFSKPGQWGEGLAQIVETPNGKDHRWTGTVRFDEKELLKPLSWKRPRKIFVCSTSDLFHENVPDEWIDQVFAVMALAPQHTFQVLTKRTARMQCYVNALVSGERSIWQAARAAGLDAARLAKLMSSLGWGRFAAIRAPLPNVWLGASVEDQARANERVPLLLSTPAVVRWLSMEPLLGPVDIARFLDAEPGNVGTQGDALGSDECRAVTSGQAGGGGVVAHPSPRIDWIVLGGESGPGARPMHPDWARDIRDQCATAGVPLFIKQLSSGGSKAIKDIDLFPADLQIREMAQ